jgi:hypothetical protein
VNGGPAAAADRRAYPESHIVHDLACTVLLCDGRAPSEMRAVVELRGNEWPDDYPADGRGLRDCQA